MIEVYATTDQNMWPGEVADHARRVERLGFDGLLVPDGVHEGLLAAQAALMATERIRVCTGVVVAFPRSPMVVAQSAWDLQASSGGRFELGLGTQVRGNIVERYSTVWTAPVARMREYIESLRAIWSSFQEGRPLDYRGKHYRFTRLQPFFNPGPIEHPDIPILVGAVGPRMTRTAGEAADGLITHPTNCSPRFLDEVVRPLLDAGDRRTAPAAVVACPLVATGETAEEVAAERERIRGLMAFLYSTPAYWPTLELLGYEDLGPKLRELTREGRWNDLAGLLPDGLLDAVVPSGTYDEIGTVLDTWYARRAARVTFPLPPPGCEDRIAGIVEALRH
ncbi:MAG: TIGR03617 family F420-dependent LLM class oxidoreductase [Deltaproteobacteria bacterium]|nr:MAG: TIGR03617 family F420-dependent LLM class oxidoreductase [Deltaproteobacteria bacterium]